jgi:nicotinamide-nucleotide amidase
MSLVGVSRESLEMNGAVSEIVVAQMAQNGRIKLNTDFCVATSGIAGPEGGSLANPVGTVWIAVSTKEGVYSQCFNFGENRERTIQMSVLTALNLVRCTLLGIEFEKKS